MRFSSCGPAATAMQAWHGGKPDSRERPSGSIAAERRVRVFIRDDVLALLEADAAPAKADLRSAPRGHGRRLAAFLESLADTFERAPSHHHDIETSLAVAVLRMRREPWPRLHAAAAHLLRRHHLGRVAEVLARLRLHLAEDEPSAAPRNDVQLISCHPHIVASTR